MHYFHFLTIRERKCHKDLVIKQWEASACCLTKKNSTLHVRSGHVELSREVIVSISSSVFCPSLLYVKMPSCHLCPQEFCFCIPILRFGTYSPPCYSLYSYNRFAIQPLPVPITSYYISSTFSDASIHLALSLLIPHSYSSISL